MKHYEFEEGDFRIRIEEDCDAQNPLDFDEGLGEINFKNDKKKTPTVSFADIDSIWVKSYNHELVITSDQKLAEGWWCPNKVILEELKDLKSDERHKKCKKFAQSAIDEYNKWRNGECYGYVAEKKKHCDACGHDEWEEVESCWGFYGEDYVKVEARRVLDALNKHKQECEK